MKIFFAFCLALLSFTAVYSQSNADTNKVFVIVQQAPKFTGDLQKWLADNIVYPAEAKNNNIQGTVYISFIVEHNGSVSTVKVMRGVEGGKMLDDEAIRVVSMMPKWTPGYQNGHTVRVAYNLPIHFRLENDNHAVGKDTMIIAPTAPPSNTTGDDPNKVFTVVQSKPEFPGDINKFLVDNINYPKQAVDSNIQGTVYVSFVVEKDGSVDGAQVLRGVANGKSLEDEALRVVSIMPKWTPGMQNGHTVRVRYMVPMHFRLGGNSSSKQKKN